MPPLSFVSAKFFSKRAALCIRNGYALAQEFTVGDHKETAYCLLETAHWFITSAARDCLHSCCHGHRHRHRDYRRNRRGCRRILGRHRRRDFPEAWLR